MKMQSGAKLFSAQMLMWQQEVRVDLEGCEVQEAQYDPQTF